MNDKTLKGFDKGLMTGMFLIDLQKAFNTNDHDVLLQTLYAICFSKHAKNWLQLFLFLVNLGKIFSQLASYPAMYPQGTFFGPLLFLIYVNDMPQALKCDLFLYADDTCSICQHKDNNKIKN